MLFLYGFITAWALLGLFAILSDMFEWGCLFFNDGFAPWVICAPWVPLILICRVIGWIKRRLRRRKALKSKHQ